MSFPYPYQWGTAVLLFEGLGSNCVGDSTVQVGPVAQVGRPRRGHASLGGCYGFLPRSYRLDPVGQMKQDAVGVAVKVRSPASLTRHPPAVRHLPSTLGVDFVAAAIHIKGGFRSHD